MKKVTYIVLGLSLVAVFSCQKEDIKPNATADGVRFECHSSDSGNEKALIGSTSNGSSGDGTSTGTADSGTTGDSDITDPNNDPDKIKKKGK